MSGRSVQIMQTQKQLTIGETSALCAVSVRMLRHWESMGLLHPTRDSNGYRLYSEDDIARIRRIRLYRDLGLTTEQIRAALDGPATETLTLMREQRARISGHITQLQLILQDIDELSAYAHNTKEDETMDTHTPTKRTTAGETARSGWNTRNTAPARMTRNSKRISTPCGRSSSNWRRRCATASSPAARLQMSLRCGTGNRSRGIT